MNLYVASPCSVIKIAWH